MFAAEFLKDRSNNARVRNTISITGIKGSDKINVIPAEASAEVDVRLLPGEEPQAVYQRDCAVCSPTIRSRLKFCSRALPPSSPASPDALKVIAEYAQSSRSRRGRSCFRWEAALPIATFFASKEFPV